MMRRPVMAGCLVLLVVLIGCAAEIQQTQRVRFWKKTGPAPAGESYVTNYYHETIITNIQRRVHDSDLILLTTHEFYQIITNIQRRVHDSGGEERHAD